jgi:hypothetical protein
MFHGVSSILLIGANSMLVNRPVTRAQAQGDIIGACRKSIDRDAAMRDRHPAFSPAKNVYLLSRMVLSQTSSGNHTIVDRVHGD